MGTEIELTTGVPYSIAGISVTDRIAVGHALSRRGNPVELFR
jgi:hypothetical protein